MHRVRRTRMILKSRSAQSFAIVLVLVFTFVVGLASSTRNSEAYQFLPQSWQNGISNLRACVAGSTSAPYANQALLDWDATPTTFGYTGSCSNPHVRFVDWAGGLGGTDGVAQFNLDANGFIIDVELFLNISYYSVYAPGARQSVASHELGHALSLDHEVGFALMNPITCSGTGTRWCWYGIETPVGDDIQGIQARYP
jgi:hypothetical protein